MRARAQLPHAAQREKLRPTGVSSWALYFGWATSWSAKVKKIRRGLEMDLVAGESHCKKVQYMNSRVYIRVSVFTGKEKSLLSQKLPSKDPWNSHISLSILG